MSVSKNVELSEESKAKTLELLRLAFEDFFSGLSTPQQKNEASALFDESDPQFFQNLAYEMLVGNPGLSETVSKVSLEKRLRNIMHDLVDGGDNLRLSLLTDKLWHTLENQDQTKRFYVPLVGVTISIGHLDLGPLRLMQMDQSAVDVAIELIAASIDRTASSMNNKVAAKDMWAKEMTANLLGTVCVTGEVFGDSRTVDDAAREFTGVALDLLRFAIPALQPKDHVAVSLKGYGVPTTLRRYILPLGVSEGYIPSLKAGAFTDLCLEDRAVSTMDGIGIFKIANLINTNRTEFQVSIFRAMHWFGESQRQDSPSYELVNLVIGLESFFDTAHFSRTQNTKRKLDKTSLICEAVTVLLYDQIYWEKHFQSIREGFAARGEVVHEGKKFAYQNLGYMRDTVFIFLQALIDRMDEFTSSSELLEWVAKKTPNLQGQTQWSHSKTKLQSNSSIRERWRMEPF